MKDFKYTTDGKKVVIIGDLNQTEKIVQEIFVTEQGDEIPQGERFVVKNLLDAPIKSWKEKNLETLEANYEKEKKYWEELTKSVISEKKKVYASLSARVKWLRNVAKEPGSEELKKIINNIADFLSNTDKWIAVKGYRNWELVQYNEDGVNSLFERFEGGYGCPKFDSMRLLSLYGKDDGSLQFRVNDYYDGSGSNKDVEFFKSKEDALLFMQNEFYKVAEYNENILETAKKYNFTLDTEKLENFKNKKKESINKSILNVESQIEKYKKEIENINQL